MTRKKKNPAAVALGKLRAKRLSPERIVEIASAGGTARAEGMTPLQRQEFARSGGLAGGKARAKTLSKAERVEIARKAVVARWEKWRAEHQGAKPAKGGVK